ncbi:unnamed protein product [Echinostoma caproni]|uniref:TRAPPC10/Trs130 N-terminal domain-containing protein n=1 Tax=Echinostoma caproni TaxID=27848 RepID=A0A3P8HFQ8_9TREM|nr:unnamed protein product [Echinostoma caproni]
MVGELEIRCSQTISKEPTMWRHSKHRGQYPVRIDASFSRFSGTELRSPIKVLSTGRPIRPVGSFQPLLYIYAISNNHTEYTTGGGRNKVASWLGHLQAGNISDWVILMIDADSPTSGPKMWQRSTVIHRIKKDFNINPDGFHFLQLPDPRAVEEKVFQDAWTTMMRALRKVILEVYHVTIMDYDMHLHLLEEARFTPGWDFFEYLDRKEELAHLYIALGGFEDALYEYYEVETFFSDCAGAEKLNDEARPPWVRQLIEVSSGTTLAVPSFLSCFPVVPSVADSDQSERIRERQGTLFDIRSYLLYKQLQLLFLLNKLHKVPSRVFSCISTTLEQSRAMKVCEEPVFESCWAFLVAVHCLGLLNRRSGANPAREDMSSINLILFAAFGPNSTLRPDDIQTNQPDLAYQPYNNVFLRRSSPVDNPVAEPLALLADVIYSYITSKTNSSKTKGKTADPSARPPPPAVCNALVDLWLVAFVHLTRLGYLLELWHGNPVHSAHAGALRALESAIHACAISTRTNLTTFGMSVHKHMYVLLSSHKMFADIYVAMGQTLTGFFKLTRRSSKAIYASSMLANFLQTLDAKQQACVLYTHALTTYVSDGWPELATHTCLRLACCLRTLLDDMNRRKLCSDSALMRYLNCCISLSCTNPDLLKTVTKACDLPPEVKPDYSLSFDAPVFASVMDQITAPDYWWHQACKVTKLFPPEQLWDCTRMIQSPFTLMTIQLDGASEQGTQVITISIDVTSHVSFIARIGAFAFHPRPDDWQSIMNYGHVAQLLHPDATTELDVSETDLATIELKRISSKTEYHLEPRSPTAARSSSDLSRFEPILQNDLTIPSNPSVTKSTEELGPTEFRRRKSSFLDVAASWATRPAWKSQEQLNRTPDSGLNVEHTYSRFSSIHQPHLSPIESPGTIPISSRFRNLR